MTIGIQHFAQRNPNATSLIAPNGREWTRGELCELANRIARALRTSGIVEGKAIAIIAPNCAEYVAIYFGAIQAGIAVVPVNWHLARHEIHYILTDSAPRAVFFHESLDSSTLETVCGSCAPGSYIIGIGNRVGLRSLEQFVDGYSCDALPPGARGAMMAYTSATTGLPKAVQRRIVDASSTLEKVEQANRAIGILPEDGNVHLCASMLYHSAPLGGVDVALQLGHSVVLAGMWEPELLLRLIDLHKVTTTFMVPSMFVRLLKLPPPVRSRYSTASLRFLLHGAAPCPIEVKEQILEWFGDVVWESYGSTEASGTLVSAAEWRKYPGTVGRPLPGCAIKVCDSYGKEVPPGEVGLVYIRPITERFEYRGDVEKTGRAYLGDFVTVGDLGYLNEAGYLFLCGRSHDLIISSGMNIYPAEIERVLIMHVAVADCAVLPEPHELLGEVPKAYVQLREGFQKGPQMTATLLRYLSTRLSLMKVPKRIEYVTEIPRDPNGKLFRRRLGDAESR
jgi:long-chain acyl-CoA synthetase